MRPDEEGKPVVVKRKRFEQRYLKIGGGGARGVDRDPVTGVVCYIPENCWLNPGEYGNIFPNTLAEWGDEGWQAAFQFHEGAHHLLIFQREKVNV